MKHISKFLLLLSLIISVGCSENLSKAAFKGPATPADKEKAPELAAEKAPAGSDTEGADFKAADESLAAPSAAPPMFPGTSMPTAAGPKETESSEENIATSGMLTAGIFDDALNLDIFSAYWKESDLAHVGISELEQPNWSNLIPEKSNGHYEGLDLSFVIDVTGSMSDELSYLQVEIDGIAAQLALLFPTIKQRYSMVSYRDEGDEFVAKKYDFTDEIGVFQRNLNLQVANGGGDYPEAMDEALTESLTLQWNGPSNAKILFLMADAPPHENRIERSFDAIFALKDKGVKIYPVAASGVADLAESLMRTSALLTGGQYIFLTDDSGVGNTHAKPKFPCYHVEKLKDVMIRVIADELSGQRSEPDPDKLIRTVGRPLNGVCALEQ